ncbi:GntR family transcriptional regulator [Alicyclobacillus mengziensis]|uniref:GntR family transcriptional regulator n=1 Tax=Alicyclobacillus mengziensis TaxID=2931921 RepID=A0A9X7VZH7_9BACL|nr:GntR family transcriptional regulator [Alicyclobacillus mengziensis]QSO47635.1 GntR family transcriptional regulator [Alicyclobacillus mengziensis]
MDIYLDINSEVPIYQQIRNQVVLGLAEGRLCNNESLPSTRQLAADFGINFHTVNKAYDILRQEGIIKLNRKTGAVIFIEPPPQDFVSQWRENAKVWLAEAIVKGVSKADIIRECEDIISQFEDWTNPSSGHEGSELS